MYDTIIDASVKAGLYELKFGKLHDRAYIFLQGKMVGVIQRPGKGAFVTIPDSPRPLALRVIVENQARYVRVVRIYDMLGGGRGVGEVAAVWWWWLGEGEVKGAKASYFPSHMLMLERGACIVFTSLVLSVRLIRSFCMCTDCMRVPFVASTMARTWTLM